MSIEFGLLCEPEIHPIRFAINFLFIIVRAEREVHLTVKLFEFYVWVNTHLFDLKFVAFCPKSSRDSYVEFQEKTISSDFFRNFVQTKAILYQNL